MLLVASQLLQLHILKVRLEIDKRVYLANHGVDQVLNFLRVLNRTLENLQTPHEKVSEFLQLQFAPLGSEIEAIRRRALLV